MNQKQVRQLIEELNRQVRQEEDATRRWHLIYARMGLLWLENDIKSKDMPDFLMIEVKEWLDNLCADADKKGIQPVDMMYLLIDKATHYALKERAEYYRLESANQGSASGK